MRPLGNRKHGDIYITGGTENRDLHKAKYFDNKRFMVRKISLSKQEANGAADAHRAQGHLARVVPRMVWINHAGWELGMEKVQGYVLYIHYGSEKRKGKTMGEVLVATNNDYVSQEERASYNASYNTWLNKQRAKAGLRPKKTRKVDCPCGSGKSPFTFEGKKWCADCAPIYIGAGD